jgi:hypothetical protein
MYVLIDFSESVIDLQPTQTIHSCNFSQSLESLQNSLNQTIKNMNELLSDYDYSDDDLTAHTLVIIKASDMSKIVFNAMTSHYVLSEPVITQASYKSCDF